MATRTLKCSYSMSTLALNSIMLMVVAAQDTFISSRCVVPYSEGSVSKPCTLCSYCVKAWDSTNTSIVDECTKNVYFYRYHSTVSKPASFNRASVGGGKTICAIKQFCHKDTDFKCKFSRTAQDWKEERVQMLSDCKCRCDGTHYGQTCNLTIPSHLSIDSFADVQNVVYLPIVFATDYATIYVYFYTMGIDMNVDVQTEFQNLRYESTSCTTKIPPLKEMCYTLFKDGGVRNYMEVCVGGPTFDEHGENTVCAVVVNIAFPKKKLKSYNEKSFLFDEYVANKSDANIVAKIEKVTVTVSNGIPNLDEGGEILLSTTFGITVVYRGKHPFEDCPVLVTIPQYSKKSKSAPSFPRSQYISLTNLVVLEDVTACENLGEPITNWFVWVFRVNHDEKNDPPLYQIFETPTLTFEPFSLEFGKYKVKSMVGFVERNFDTAFSHCYFEITPIPLQPLIFGGSLRYIYYKSNFQLVSDILVDPNYPLDAQPKLKRDWYCNNADDKICDKISGYETVINKYGPFTPGKVYHFTMSVQSPLLPVETCHQTIIISKDSIPNLLIECLRNCGGKGFKSDTREIVYFKVSNSIQDVDEVKQNTDFNWTYSTDNNSFIDVHDIRQEEETPSWILIVNENSLKDNQEYTFKVSGGGEINGEAQIQICMFKYYDKFQCNINPKKGIAGSTKFSIECNKAEFEQNSYLSLNVYFYDKYKESDEFGRLLGSNYLEVIDDIVLTRGTVMVKASNIFGQFQKTHVQVSLSFPDITPEFLNESIKNLDRLSENEGYDQKLSYISSLCDVLNKEPSVKGKYIETFLEKINKEDSFDLVNLELMLSATQSVLCNENNCTDIKLSDRSYKHLTEILVDVSGKLVKELQRTAKGQSDITTSKLSVLYTSLIKCTGISLSVQNKKLLDKHSMTIDYNLYDLYKIGNMKVLHSLERVNEALSLKNIPYIKHTAVRTEFVDTWMKEDTPIYFTKGTKGNYSGSYIQMTQSLAKSLSKFSHHIVVYVMAFKNNPYWWSQTETVSTQVVSLSFGVTRDFKTYTPIKSFNHSVDIFLQKKNNQNVTVRGRVIQPDPDNDAINKDLAVNVHQIYTLKGEKISLKFIDLKDKDAFRVSVLKNRRPDYDMVVEGTVVNNSSPWYRSAKEIKVTEDDDVVFVGVLPGPSVLVNDTRSYQFELQSARCQVWYDFLWDASGCSLGPNSSEEFLHCQCTHLSSVAGFLGVPINTINPLKDYTLFLSIPENPFVLALILTILLIYVLLLVWSYVANKRDMQRTSMIILEDNISVDNYGYLVIVFTGSRIYAGTTSNIGIILHGSQASSRSHILKSTKRLTLTRANDDWFLIYTHSSLGVISSIQLWSDHRGTSPNWFCDRIHVHDFSLEKDYSFLIGKWFGVTQLETRVMSYARPIKLDQRDHLVDFILTNIVFGFRESHMWVSILSKHPRSPMTRAQRLSIAMVALVTTLLGCILFYDAALPEDEDLPGYSVSTREALISMYTMCISITLTGMVFVAFSKSYSYQQPEGAPVRRKFRRSTRIPASRVQVDSADTLRQRKKAKRGYKYYIKKAIISLRQEHFYPIQATASTPQEQQIVVHKVRLILSWILCACIILVFCFFTVWLGLKIGRNKSLLWLTSIGMALMEDTFIVDPVKIVSIALLLGMVQTQLCDLYAYDPKIYQIRKSVTQDLEKDQQIHRMRLKPLYKPVCKGRLEAIHDQQRVVKKWWTLIDIFDIIFSVFVIFCIIERYVHKDYLNTNLLLKNIVFNRINPDKNLIPTPAVSNVSSYSIYLQDSVFSAIYCTQWYNNDQLTEQNESFAETGWTKTLTHRIMGVPRLRQIRVRMESCHLPSALKNQSVYCNIPYSQSTEDTEYYSAQWENYTTEYIDVIFRKSPWIYTFPDEVSAYRVALVASQTGELFHGAGYIAELTRVRRKSAGTLLNLVDLDWIDLRTRVIFFEISAYNVNNNVFTAITLIVEHLESGLVLSSNTIRSISFESENVLLEVVFFLYSVLVLFKHVMVLNTVGPKVFFSSFWTLYDLCFILTGLSYFIGYRIVLKMFSDYINDFQRSGKEEFFPFAGLMFTKTLDRYIMSLLLILATARSLRLLEYESGIIHIKYRYTLYFAWPQILCVSFVLLFFMYGYQRLFEYLVDCLYPLGISHWLQHKMNFSSLQRAVVTPNTTFVYIPCCLACIGIVFYVLVLIESYSRANAVYVKILHEEAF